VGLIHFRNTAAVTLPSQLANSGIAPEPVSDVLLMDSAFLRYGRAAEILLPPTYFWVPTRSVRRAAARHGEPSQALSASRSGVDAFSPATSSGGHARNVALTMCSGARLAERAAGLHLTPREVQVIELVNASRPSYAGINTLRGYCELSSR
jgi:hypothetical protein